jgi:hypothetical protein
MFPLASMEDSIFQGFELHLSFKLPISEAKYFSNFGEKNSPLLLFL